MPCPSTTPGAGRGAGRSGHCVRGAARSSTLRAVVTSPSGLEGAPGATPDPMEPEPGAGCDPGSAGLPPASGPEACHMAKRAGGPRSQDAPLPGSGIREPEAGRRTVLRRFVEDVTDKGLPVDAPGRRTAPRARGYGTLPEAAWRPGSASRQRLCRGPVARRVARGGGSAGRGLLREAAPRPCYRLRRPWTCTRRPGFRRMAAARAAPLSTPRRGSAGATETHGKPAMGGSS